MPPKKKKSGGKKKAGDSEKQYDGEIYVMQKKVEALQHRIGKMQYSICVRFSSKGGLNVGSQRKDNGYGRPISTGHKVSLLIILIAR